jgi:hypothetical protein
MSRPVRPLSNEIIRTLMWRAQLYLSECRERAMAGHFDQVLADVAGAGIAYVRIYNAIRKYMVDT